MRELYLFDNKDNWLELDKRKKLVRIINIQTQKVTEYPFLTSQHAKSNFFEWLRNQEIRLPKTFIIDMTIATTNLYDNLAELMLPTPTNKEKQHNKWLIYHTNDKHDKYVYMTVDKDFTNSILPILSNRYILKVLKHTKTSKNNLDHNLYTLNTGIFAPSLRK